MGIQGLLRELLHLIGERAEARKAVLAVYGEVLSQRNLQEDSALAFCAAQDLPRALEAYKAAGHWQMALTLAGYNFSLLSTACLCPVLHLPLLCFLCFVLPLPVPSCPCHCPSLLPLPWPCADTFPLALSLALTSSAPFDPSLSPAPLSCCLQLAQQPPNTLLTCYASTSVAVAVQLAGAVWCGVHRAHGMAGGSGQEASS